MANEENFFIIELHSFSGAVGPTSFAAQLGLLTSSLSFSAVLPAYFCCFYSTVCNVMAFLVEAAG